MNALEMLKARVSVESVTERLKAASNSYESDSRLWFPLLDEKKKTGSAIIRFLPNSFKEPNTPDWLIYHKHSYKNAQGKWYIETCPTTYKNGFDGASFGECPVCIANKHIWDTNTKDVARQLTTMKGKTRKTKYVCNILVVQDSATPENNGKVFLYEFGRTIFTKIYEQIEPMFDTDTPNNPFDPFHGCNFNLRVTRKDNNANYDTSVFLPPSPIGTDEEIIDIWQNKCHGLQAYFQEVIAASIKPMDALQARFDMVEGKKSAGGPAPQEAAWVPDVDDNDDESSDVNMEDEFQKLLAD